MKRTSPSITIEINGQQTPVAASPLERLTWCGQVQGDPDLNDSDAATALMLARYINAKAGCTWKGGDIFARLLGIGRRAFADRLARLVSRGHIHVRRRGREPAALYAIILPDFVPDVQRHRTSSNHDDVQRGCISSASFNVQSGRISKTEKISLDVQNRRRSMCSDQKNIASKSNDYGPRTREVQGMYSTAAVKNHPTNSFCDGPGELDEILFDDPRETPPPPDAARLDAMPADELSRPEPSGWREFLETHPPHLALEA